MAQTLIFSTLSGKAVYSDSAHIQHNCELNDLRAGFEIAEGHWIRHGPDANIQHAVGQGGLI